jgi:hypothetical protein
MRQLLNLDPAAPPLQARDDTELMALCTVRQSPDAVLALLATDPATAAETAAMRTLGSTLTGCVARGKSMQLNKPALRVDLALAAYRIANQAPTAPRSAK